MNAAGIDVSKGKSMVSVLRPLGEVVAKPFAVRHTGSELKELAAYLKSLDGETRVIMKHTGRYYEPVAQFLHDAGLYVSAVNPKLIKDYGNNSLRKVKTDKADSKKLRNMVLTTGSNCGSMLLWTPFVTNFPGGIMALVCLYGWAIYLTYPLAL